MPKFPKKPCKKCGTIFQPHSQVHDYCSNSCRTQAHRERNSIEEPSFLNNHRKPVDTSPQETENALTQSLDVPYLTTDRIPNFGDIGITEYVPNPAYVQAVKDYRTCIENTFVLENKRKDLKIELHKLSGGLSKMRGAVLGGLATVALGFTTIYFKSKNVNPLWYLLLIPAAIAGAMAGASLAIAAYFGSDKAQKLATANEKEKEILKVEQEIVDSKAKEKNIKIERDAVQKQIARYEKIAKDEDYLEFQEVTNQKAISLESLKSKKFKVLDFSDKWETLVGTPEANFCMMVYGKPGQGKSYFTLEFSEYLASNFGTVLFNSAEEGSSLSLQNKIVDFNMENIFLGSADNINSLQFLLTKSPYKFVVIDSINHMNITSEDLRKLRGLHPAKGFICILQSTKNGDFKGSNEFEHDADISIKIDNRIPECMKTRYK